ncbi:MAG: DUF4954 family protein, partial [Paludibacter sp.]|nr:DUF4954 family protein [Paludibacter sp.]
MFRTLADKEIATLVVYGCSADDWKSVEVADGFNPNYVQNVHFSGKIRLGVFDKTFELPDGIRHCAGVYNCILHNCAIANNVYINKINNYIANCEIGEGAYIENVNLITTEGETSFGNGVRVAAVNENGKRSVPIFDKLSAQFAYIFAFYLHRPEMIERLTQLVYSYANTKKSSTGIIGKNVKIVNCGTIKNVKIGDNAEISGATSLENGSVNSSENALVAIANGVIMKNFIISSAAKITDFALLENCFVGQNCIVGKGFSAIDSLFFAHCEMFHGEAVSAFAAPFTVSHHKSSLLIAGAFLFANIGSGANQSNHGYRSGAVHQGVYGRGTKFGSNSYLLLPAETGIFTLVAGEHKNHLDTRLFPFSYLIGKCGESYLYPARNFVNAGTVRDIEKWKQRYKVTENEQLDFINFSLLNPFSIQKIQNGMFFMADRQKDFNGDFYEFGNCKISKNNFKNGIKTYAIALDIYLGNAVNERLKDINIENADALHARLQPDFEAGRGAWVDIAGLVAPKSEIDKLLDLIENGKINLEDIQQYFSDLHANFAKMEWTWIFYRLLEYFEKPLNEITAEDIKNQQTLFAIQQEKYQKLLDADAEKDFAENTKISYGVDCN